MLDPLAHPWRFAGALCLLVLLRGIALMCILPPGEGWDEYQHVAYVHELAEGRGSPVLNQTSVDRDVISAAVEVPMSQSAFAQLETHGAVTYEQYWQAVYREPNPGAGEVPLYQAQHAPLWYRTVVPVYAWAGGAGNWRGSVAALRAANLLLLCIATLLAVSTIRVLWPGNIVAAIAAIAVATSPMMLLSAVRAANDAMAMALAVACILCVALGLKRRPWWVIPAALLAGVAFWAKTTSVALLPFGAGTIALCLPGRWRLRLTWATIFTSIVIAIIAPYLIQSHATYGVLIPTQESVHNHQAGHDLSTMLQATLKVDWLDEVHAWWTRGTLWIGGWTFIRPAGLWRTIYAFLLTTGVGAWIVSLAVPSLRSRGEQITSWRIGVFCLLLIASYTAALAAHAVSSQLAWGAVKTNPWYASAAIPMLLLLVATGYARVLPAKIASGVVVSVALVYLVVEIVGLVPRMPARYAMEPLWSGGMWRLASFQPALLGQYTFLAVMMCELVLLALIATALYRLRLSMCQKET